MFAVCLTLTFLLSLTDFLPSHRNKTPGTNRASVSVTLMDAERVRRNRFQAAAASTQGDLSFILKLIIRSALAPGVHTSLLLKSCCLNSRDDFVCMVKKQKLLKLSGHMSSPAPSLLSCDLVPGENKTSTCRLVLIGPYRFTVELTALHLVQAKRFLSVTSHTSASEV